MGFKAENEQNAMCLEFYLTLQNGSERPERRYSEKKTYFHLSRILRLAACLPRPATFQVPSIQKAERRRLCCSLPHERYLMTVTLTTFTSHFPRKWCLQVLLPHSVHGSEIAISRRWCIIFWLLFLKIYSQPKVWLGHVQIIIFNPLILPFWYLKSSHKGIGIYSFPCRALFYQIIILSIECFTGFII